MQSSGASDQHPREGKQLLIAIAAIVHALLVTAWWWAAIYADVAVVSSGVWLVAAWGWLIWPVALLVARAQASRLTVGSVVVGALVIVPSVPTIYTFTAWSIGGFAP
jgi:hypothetical protein